MRLGLASSIAIALHAVSASAADPPRPTATIACPRVSEPGRVKCDVEARAPAGASIRWGDVVVVRAPPFATPLRARVGPREASAREDAVWRWTMAFAANARAAGDVEVRVRLVACAAKDDCAPYEVGATARVVVGE